MANINGASPAAVYPGGPRRTNSPEKLAGSNALGVQRQLNPSQARSSALVVPKEKLLTRLLSALGFGKSKPLSENATKGLFLQRLSAFATRRGIEVPDKLSLATEFAAQTRSRNADVLLREADSFIERAIPGLKMNAGRDDKAAGNSASALQASAVADQRSRDAAGIGGKLHDATAMRSPVPRQPPSESKSEADAATSKDVRFPPAEKGPRYNFGRLTAAFEAKGKTPELARQMSTTARSLMRNDAEFGGSDVNDRFLGGKLDDAEIGKYVDKVIQGW
jgi:hypothetical protein